MADKIRLESSDDDGSGNRYELTDSEDQYSEEEKEIMEEIRKGKRRDDDNGKKEILGFADSDDDEADDEEVVGDEEGDADEDDDDMNEMLDDSDIEGAEDNDDLPDAMDWGKNKRNYYNADFVDPDYDGYNEEQEDLAIAEEEEAKAIQQRLAKQMNEEDFNLADMFPNVKIDESDEEEPNEKKSKVTKTKADLADLTDREKEQLFHKDSPEFKGLVTDLKAYLSEVAHLINPVMDYVKENNLPMIPAFEYAEFYQKLALTYCLNINFYLYLKIEKISVKYHPVIKRLVQFKKMLMQFKDRYENIIRPQLKALLERIKDDDKFEIIDPRDKEAQKMKQLNIMDVYNQPNKMGELKTQQNVEDHVDDDEYSDDDKSDDMDIGSSEDEKDQQKQIQEEGFEKEVDAEEEVGAEEENEESRRAITYQIAKNKGLTPHRKKELRNPRVKHRSKYRKALIRRKGAVRSVRKEIKRYDGEISGIKASVNKGIKIKV